MVDRYSNRRPTTQTGRVAGGGEECIASGGEMTGTESAINLETLVSKYLFEKE